MDHEEPPRMGVDADVIQRALEGDRSVLAQIYDEYAKPVYRYLYSRVGNAADAEDLTSQTFMAVLEALPRYQHRNSFTAWVFQIARDKAMDHFRVKHASAEIPEWVSNPAQVDALEALAGTETRRQLRVLLHGLDEDERELIRLRYSAELSFVEIARLLGRKEDAVRKSIRRLLDRLSIQLEAQNV